MGLTVLQSGDECKDEDEVQHQIRFSWSLAGPNIA
jgi:hypothetical protein